MFFNLFRDRNRSYLTWRLIPKRYPKESPQNYGGKIILPHRILEELVINDVRLPYIFEISTNDIFKTNCGCLEFTCQDDEVIVPEWMYDQLDLENNEIVTIKYSYLPQGKYVKLLPHNVEFLDVENPKFELEKYLRDYQVLTKGDEILCRFEEIGNVRFTVTDVDPGDDGIYIVDTDLSVEFLPPIGYAEKCEDERSVMKYVEMCEEKGKEVIRMKKFGLWFDENK